MKERTKFLIEWERRWNEGEGNVNVSALCCQFGISRDSGHRLIARVKAFAPLDGRASLSPQLHRDAASASGVEARSPAAGTFSTRVGEPRRAGSAASIHSVVAASASSIASEPS